MHLCGMDYKHFSSHCCTCNSFGCTVAIRCGNACHRPHNSSLYSGGEYSQFNSPRLVKREAGFPNPRRALIGSNQLWRVNDSPYYRELFLGLWFMEWFLWFSEIWLIGSISNLVGAFIMGLPGLTKFGHARLNPCHFLVSDQWLTDTDTVIVSEVIWRQGSGSTLAVFDWM